jgi:hypothetical protein
VGPFHLFRFSLEPASLRTGEITMVLRWTAVRSCLAPAAQRKTNETHQEIRKNPSGSLTTSAS